MKQCPRLLLAFLLTLCGLQAAAQEPSAPDTWTAHMTAVNEGWASLPADDRQTSYVSSSDRISAHLLAVTDSLEERTPDLTAGQLSARKALLQDLRSYAQAGIFPMNIGHAEPTPYFIDHRGVACAVGHMMIRSGHEELALRIQARENNAYLRDIETEGVMTWASTHGFDLEELAWIQPAYIPECPMLPLANGVDGVITALLADADNERLYMAGEFYWMDNAIAGAGLGYWEDGAYYAVPDAPQGLTRDLLIGPDERLYLLGEFTMGNISYPVAAYDGQDWEYIDLPARPGCSGRALVFSAGSEPDLALAIRPVGADQDEVWYRADYPDGQWQHICTAQGEIHCSHLNGYLFMAGEFDAFVDHLSQDALVSTSSILAIDLYPSSNDSIYPLLADSLPQRIQCMEGQGSTMYFGGGGTGAFPRVYVSRYQNGLVSPQLIRYGQEPVTEEGVTCMLLDESGEELLCGGEFEILGPGGGSNIGSSINLVNIAIDFPYEPAPFAHLDDIVSDLSHLDGVTYVGGAYTQCSEYSELSMEISRIGYIGQSTGITELGILPLSFYPNPSQDLIQLEADPRNKYAIYDPQGAPVLSGQGNRVDLSALAAGAYFLRSWNDGGSYGGLLIKE